MIDPQRSCESKKRYSDKKAAVTSINYAWRRKRRGHRPKYDLRAYHCEYCNGWHIAHQKPYRT